MTEQKKTVEQEIAEVLEKYPKAEVFEGDFEVPFVFDKPLRPHVSRFNKTIMDGDPQFASENILRDCRRYPDKETLERFFQEEPAAVPPLATAVMKLAGGDKKFSPRSRGSSGS